MMTNLPYNIIEYIVLIFSVLIGSGAYISFVFIKNKQKIGFKYIIAVLLINLCFTYIASGILMVFKWGEWKSPALPMVAFGGQYLTDWIDKNYLKILNTAAKKAGVDVNNNQNDNNIKTSENENK